MVGGCCACIPGSSVAAPRQAPHACAGVVYKARDRETQEFVAIKKLRYSYDESGLPDSTLREIATLRELQHDNIVQ